MRTTGRQPCASQKVAAQKHRRSVLQARDNISIIISGLFEKKVISIQDVSGAPEVRRLKWATETLTKAGVKRCTIAALLLLDWAARKPEVTAVFLSTLEAIGGTFEPASVFAHFRLVNADPTRESFWKGTGGLCIQNFLRSVTDDQLLRFGSCFKKATELRSEPVLEKLREMKYLDSWGAYAALRAITAAMDIKLRDQKTAAQRMTLHTSLLLTVYPNVELGYFLQRITGVRKNIAFVSFIACEVTKILKYENIVQPLSSYLDNKDAFLRALVSSDCRGLGDRISQMKIPEYSKSREIVVSESYGVPSGMSDTDIAARWKAIKKYNEPPSSAQMKRPASAV